MKYKIIEKDGVIVITPKGTIYDDSKLEKLRNEMKKMVSTGSHRMVINFGDVPGMATDRGLSVLIEISYSLKKVGGKLVLARITEKIKELLFITKLVEYFECYPSVEEAVKALKD